MLLQHPSLSENDLLHSISDMLSWKQAKGMNQRLNEKLDFAFSTFDDYSTFYTFYTISLYGDDSTYSTYLKYTVPLVHLMY